MYTDFILHPNKPVIFTARRMQSLGGTSVLSSLLQTHKCPFYILTRVGIL